MVRSTDTPGPVDRDATIVVDALLGTGFREPVEGRYAELIATINGQFPRAKVVAVDIPSAMQVRADFTVTFAAPKAEMVLDRARGQRREADCRGHRNPGGISASGSGIV